MNRLRVIATLAAALWGVLLPQASSLAEQQRVPITRTGWEWNDEREEFDPVQATVAPDGHVTTPTTPLALPPVDTQSRSRRHLPAPGGGDDEDCTYVHGVCQGTWNPDTDDPWNRVPPWDRYWEQDPSGTPWKEYGFEDPRPPVEEHEFVTKRQPGVEPHKSAPDSVGAFNPKTGLYDHRNLGGRVTHDTPGRVIGIPDDQGGCKGSGNCSGKATTPRGLSAPQGGALQLLEARNPQLAKEVIRMDMYYNPYITYDMVNNASSDEELVAFLTTPPDRPVQMPDGTLYIPWNASGSTRSSDYRRWNAQGGGDDGNDDDRGGRRLIGDRGSRGSNDDTDDAQSTPPPTSGRCGPKPPFSDLDAWREWFMCMQ